MESKYNAKNDYPDKIYREKGRHIECVNGQYKDGLNYFKEIYPHHFGKDDHYLLDRHIYFIFGYGYLGCDNCVSLWKRDESSSLKYNNNNYLNKKKKFENSLDEILSIKDNKIQGNNIKSDEIKSLIDYNNKLKSFIILQNSQINLLEGLKNQHENIINLKDIEINRLSDDNKKLENEANKLNDQINSQIEKLDNYKEKNKSYRKTISNLENKLNSQQDNGNINYSSIKDQDTFDILKSRELDINDLEHFICESDENYLECVICNTVVRNPQKCNECQKLICTACIKTWTEKFNECPHCNNEPYKKMLLSGLELSYMNKILINCSLCDSEKFEYNNMIKHYQSNHKMIEYKCKLCNKIFQQINNKDLDMKFHYKECMIICVYCDKSYSRKEIINHVEECKEKQTCSKCNENYPLRFNQAHNEFYCRRIEYKNTK